MNYITVNIDGIPCEAKEGEYVLNVARRNGIFIPAICYLTRCSPTLACRLCVVKVDDKIQYACNLKVKDGMVVFIQDDDLNKERISIMEVYNINHPLECGVCDKSGECELQNYTLYLDVSKQEYSIEDSDKKIQKWGFINYDPYLCIVCEKCIKVCKDMIGEGALKLIPREGSLVGKELKSSMPPNSFSMWNKLQKSIIGPASKTGELECSSCGECVAVCPVGALTENSFFYKSNSWELRKIPSSNPHSSDCSFLYYEVKHNNIDDASDKIYRVTNEHHFSTLSGGARFGSSYFNKSDEKDKSAFDKCVSLLKTKADTISFSSYITNEEALILQSLKEKYSYKLVNSDAFYYKNFLDNFSTASNTELYNGSLDEIPSSDFIISLGTNIRYDVPNISYSVNNATKINKSSFVYFHPISDKIIKENFKNTIVPNYRVGYEESVLYLILDMFADKETLPSYISEYLLKSHKIEDRVVIKNVMQRVTKKIKQTLKDSSTGESKIVEKEIVTAVPKKVSSTIKADISDFETKVGLDYEDMCKIKGIVEKKSSFMLILGSDLYAHPRAKNLALLAGLIQKHTKFKVLIIPSQTNTLGVSLICDLDEKGGDYTIGYNTKGDFILSALGDGDMNMPSLNQQEGTFTNIDKRVVPINVAIDFKGYFLNDIANELGIYKSTTVDYTKELPLNKGYSLVEFDKLKNHYDNSGKEVRGYLLKNRVKSRLKMDKVSLKELRVDNYFDKINVYRCNPILQFNSFTNESVIIKSSGGIYVSLEFLEKYPLKDGDIVRVGVKNSVLELRVILDESIGGLISYIPTFDKSINSNIIFDDNFRYKSIHIEAVK